MNRSFLLGMRGFMGKVGWTREVGVVDFFVVVWWIVKGERGVNDLV